VAAFRCSDCGVFLCEPDRQAHQRAKGTKSHQIVPIEELGTSPALSLRSPSMCFEHPKEELKLFCNSCSKPICRDCTLLEHKSHEFVFLSEVSSKEKEELEKLLAVVRTQIETLEKGLGSVKEAKKKVSQKTKLVSEDIGKCFDEIRDNVEMRRKVLLYQIEAIQGQKMNSLQTQETALEKALGEFRDSFAFVEKLMKEGNDVEILAMKKEMVSRLSELKKQELQVDPKEDAEISFLPKNKKSLETAIEYVGLVLSLSTCPPLCTATGEGLTKVFEKKPASFVVIAKDQNSQQRKEGGDAIKVLIEGPDGEKWDGTVVDRADGSYLVTYTPKQPGMHSIVVSIKGELIEKSPFKVDVQSAKVTIDLSKGGFAQPQKFSKVTANNNVRGYLLKLKENFPLKLTQAKVQLILPQNRTGYMAVYNQKGEVVAKAAPFEGKGPFVAMYESTFATPLLTGYAILVHCDDCEWLCSNSDANYRKVTEEVSVKNIFGTNRAETIFAIQMQLVVE
jgi:tripartite motif-containing protein 45